MKQQYTCKTKFEFESLKRRTGRTAPVPNTGNFVNGPLEICFGGEVFNATVVENYQHAYLYVKVILGR